MWKEIQDREGFVMVASCRGICIRYEVAIIASAPKYSTGHKRCNFCSIFLKTNSLRCPCCRLVLRTKSRVNPKRRGDQVV
jgi:hypothetical protein